MTVDMVRIITIHKDERITEPLEENHVDSANHTLQTY